MCVCVCVYLELQAGGHFVHKGRETKKGQDEDKAQHAQAFLCVFERQDQINAEWSVERDKVGTA